MIAMNDLAVSNDLDSQAMEAISGAKCGYKRPVCFRPRRRFCSYLRGYKFNHCCKPYYRKCWKPVHPCFIQPVRRIAVAA